jgi:hypothetical protein
MENKMIKRLAQIAMVISILYYTFGLGFIWIGQITGLHNEIWEMYDFPIQYNSPPMWALIIGLFVSVMGICSLALSYFSVWKILEGGRDQDFRHLGKRLQSLAYGLIGFWFFYNVLVGGVQYLITIGVADTSDFDFGWDPLDLDIIFLIVAIGILAISQTLERAWIAEDETKHFL